MLKSELNGLKVFGCCKSVKLQAKEKDVILLCHLKILSFKIFNAAILKFIIVNIQIGLQGLLCLQISHMTDKGCSLILSSNF